MNELDRNSLLVLIEEMLPKPVEVDTPRDGSLVLVGGNPGEVVVRIIGGRVRIAEFCVWWEGPHTPVFAHPG